MSKLQQIACAVLLVATPLTGKETLRMQVSPSAARAPATVTVYVAFDAAPDDRFVRVIAESSTFYRSSEIGLDGGSESSHQVFEFRNLPAGVYQVTGVLGGAQGQRAAVVRVIEVAP